MFSSRSASGRMTLLVVSVLLALLALLPGVGMSQNRRLVVAYYVPWDARSWHALEANPGSVDIVSPQWMSVNPCGGLSSQDNQTLKQFARARGLSVFPNLVTFSGWL